jgi:hypothetical protein
MRSIFLIKAALVTTTILISSCCPKKYKKEDIEFTDKELQLLGNYKRGDMIFFESNIGNTDTIQIIEFYEERFEKTSCFMSRAPYHYRTIEIKHLPIDNWAKTSNIENRGKKIEYQELIAISKKPLNSRRNLANYSIEFKGFDAIENAFDSLPKEIIINDKKISECYKVAHFYPERVINPNDIEIVYWTAKYGLTAYSSKSGETWLIKDYK